LAFLVKLLNFSQNLGIFMDNLGKNWQLINILFCGYRQQLEIHHKCMLKPILARAQAAPVRNYRPITSH
jgi:hypothetical protein